MRFRHNCVQCGSTIDLDDCYLVLGRTICGDCYWAMWPEEDGDSLAETDPGPDCLSDLIIEAAGGVEDYVRFIQV